MITMTVPWWWPTAWIFILLAVYFFGVWLGAHFDRPFFPMYRRDMNKSERGREIAEQRRSNAAGKHGKRRKDRFNVNRKEIERSKED